MSDRRSATSDDGNTRRVRPPEYVPGKLIVRFKEDALRPARAMAAARSKRGALSSRRLPEQVEAPLEMLQRQLGLKRIDPLLVPPPQKADAAHLTHLNRGVLSLAASVDFSPRERLRGYSVIEVEADQVPAETIRRVNASNAVQFVERMPNRWLSRADVDPSSNLQWGLRAINWFGIVPPARAHIARNPVFRFL